MNLRGRIQTLNSIIRASIGSWRTLSFIIARYCIYSEFSTSIFIVGLVKAHALTFLPYHELLGQRTACVRNRPVILHVQIRDEDYRKVTCPSTNHVITYGAIRARLGLEDLPTTVNGGRVT